MIMRSQCAPTPRHEDGRPMEADLARLCGQLQQEPSTMEIILFGSGARADLGPRSDLDLAVVTTVRDTRRYASSLRRRLPPARAIDLVVTPENDWARCDDDSREIIRMIRSDGRSLWRRGDRTSMLDTPAGEPVGWREGAYRYEAESDWRRAYRCYTLVWMPYSDHRTGAWSRLAALAALELAMGEAGHHEVDRKDLWGSVQRAGARGVRIRCGEASVRQLDGMRRWLFVGDARPSGGDAYRALTTGLSILHACGLLKEERRPRRLTEWERMVPQTERYLETIRRERKRTRGR